MDKIIDIPPADLLIDTQNPRIPESNNSQQQALFALAKHLGSKLYSLAEDILTNGLDPSNLPLVTPFPPNHGRYVVLEGNRRLAAIRALDNPDTVNGAVSLNMLAKIRGLSRNYQSNPIEMVRCVVVADREKAQHWIKLRHTGENAGAGIVPWGADESARFRARTEPAEPSFQALDFLQSRGDLTSELRRNIPLTNFKRLIDTPVVRGKLGIEVRNGGLFRLADEALVAKAFMHIVNDLVSGNTKVGQIYTQPQREEYANNFPANIVVNPTMARGNGVSISEPAGVQDTQSITKKSTAIISRDNKRLIPSSCVLSVRNKRIRAIEKELRRLSVRDYTNAVAVLFRVFIELSVDSYVETNNLSVPGKKLQTKMAAVGEDLLKKKKLTEKQRTPVSRACQRDSFLAPSVTLMHKYVHNEYVFPAPGDLRAHWDNLEPFLEAIWCP